MAKKKVRRKQDIPKDETKAARFERVVTPRVGKAVKAIRAVAFCAGSSYEHTPEQLDQIIDILRTATKALAEAYSPSAKSNGDFAFKK